MSKVSEELKNAILIEIGANNVARNELHKKTVNLISSLEKDWPEEALIASRNVNKWVYHLHNKFYIFASTLIKTIDERFSTKPAQSIETNEKYH